MPDSIIPVRPAVFEAALSFVLEKEGGSKITDDPKDSGGLTKWGISQRAYPDVNIRALTRDDAAALYYRDYWLAGGCGNVPAGVAVMMFDTAVNQGVGAAAKLLQLAVGTDPDGHVGPKTLAAVQRMRPADLLTEYAARRMVRYGTTKGFDIYGLGWSRRLMDCLALALAA